MTIIMPTSAVCAVCGERSGQAYLKSTNGTGDFDLDFRRHGMIRDTINVWISSCPYCGYCAPNISRYLKKTKEVVMSEEYQRQRMDTRYPDKANEFLCSSMVYEGSGSYGMAAQYCLYAAWICDDIGHNKESVELRGRVVDLIGEAVRRSQPLRCCPKGGEDILLIDLLRRSGRFEEAKDGCDNVLNGKIRTYPQLKKGLALSEDLKTQLIRYESELIVRNDSSRHSYFEII